MVSAKCAASHAVKSFSKWKCDGAKLDGRITIAIIFLDTKAALFQSDGPAVGQPILNNENANRIWWDICVGGDAGKANAVGWPENWSALHG